MIFQKKFFFFVPMFIDVEWISNSFDMSISSSSLSSILCECRNECRCRFLRFFFYVFYFNFAVFQCSEFGIFGCHKIQFSVWFLFVFIQQPPTGKILKKKKMKRENRIQYIMQKLCVWLIFRSLTKQERIYIV